MKNRLQSSILAFLIIGLLSISVAYGQTRTNTATRRIGPTLTSAPLRMTRPVWSWPSWRINQPRIQQQQPAYRTYWTNPNPDRKFPRITEQAVNDLHRRN